MSFLNGRATIRRFRVVGPNNTNTPNETHLSLLGEHASGRSRMLSGDGVEIGWTAGDHVLDTTFDWGKNHLDGALLFAFRTDTMKLPADLLKSYYQIDLAALAKDNPSGRPSARQKREAKESARDRLETESRDGRFIKRKAVEVLWDMHVGELWLATASNTNLDRFVMLFQQTFVGLKLEVLGAGRIAYQIAEEKNSTREMDNAIPSPFLPGISPAEIVWNVDESSRDFLGNEFLLWLWFQCSEDSAELLMPDGSQTTCFFSKYLALDCPRGMTGKEAFSHEGPARMPEAMRGLQGGKLPRKAGLTLVRHDVQSDGMLVPEDMIWSGVKLPAPEEDDAGAFRSARLEQLREFVRTSDMLFETFLNERLGKEWAKTVGRITKWLGREGGAS